eukprot:COSAG06_NODE_61058_length_269_cov_0.547059_1_plen_52_part_01
MEKKNHTPTPLLLRTVLSPLTFAPAVSSQFTAPWGNYVKKNAGGGGGGARFV